MATAKNSKGQNIFKEIVLEKCNGLVLKSSIEEVTQEDFDKELSDYNLIIGEGFEPVCDHTFIFDEPGFMYDIRCCAICGSGLGSV